MAYVPIEPGSVWRLMSGRLVKIIKCGRMSYLTCRYVDERGQPTQPIHKNAVALSTTFLEVYCKRVFLDKVD